MQVVSGLGLTAGEAVTVLQKIGPHLDTIALVINDPAFPTLMARIKTLNELEKQRALSGVLGAIPSQNKVGVGLKWAVKGLDAVIYARQNPWSVGLAGAGFVVFIGGLGFLMGRSRRRCAVPASR